MGDLINVDREEENPGWLGWWSELPESLKKDVLACLPVESLGRFSVVCNEWNALFSSTIFITNTWAKAIPNHKPLLLLCNSDSELPAATYSFFTNTWETFISFKFLQEANDCRRAKLQLSYHGSVAGLFLVGASDQSRDVTYHVCNPLSRTSLQLPTMLSIKRITAMGIYSTGKCPQTYNVVAVGGYSDREIVEIYDSSTNCWSIAGQMPGNIKLLNMRTGGRFMIFCNGSFYSTVINRGTAGLGRWGILGFNIADATSNVYSLPLERPNFAIIRLPRLLTCGSKVLIVGDILSVEDQQPLRTVLIWEFHSLAEIARMPPSMFNRFPLLRFDCTGVEDCVCFMAYEGWPETKTDVAVYNLNKKSWDWLPSCPMASPINCMSFEARLDINV